VDEELVDVRLDGGVETKSSVEVERRVSGVRDVTAQAESETVCFRFRLRLRLCLVGCSSSD
jgi:hypothetical protein